MRGLLLAVSVFVLGCGPSPPRPDSGCGVGPGQVEVGRGGSRLIALLPEGDEVAIVVGAQGGVHLVVGAWVADMDLEMTLQYTLEDAVTGEEVAAPTVVELRPSLFSPATGGRFARHPDLLVLDNDLPRVEDFAGRVVDLGAEAVSVDGSHACDARRVTLVAP